MKTIKATTKACKTTSMLGFVTSAAMAFKLLHMVSLQKIEQDD